MKYQIKQNKKGFQAIFFGDKQITKWSEEYFILNDHYFIQLKDNKCAIFSFNNPDKPLTQSYDVIIPELHNDDIYVAIENENEPLNLTVCSLKNGKLYDVSLDIDIDTSKYNLIDLIPDILFVNDSLLVANISILRPEVYFFCYPDGKALAYTDYLVYSLDTKSLIKKYVSQGIIPIRTLKHIYVYDINGKLQRDIYLSEDIEDLELAI